MRVTHVRINTATEADQPRPIRSRRSLFAVAASGGALTGCRDATSPIALADSTTGAVDGAAESRTSDGSVESAPAIAVVGPRGPSSRTDCVRFLNQTSFGASKATISALLEAPTYEAWIDGQLALEPSLTEPFVVEDGNGSLSTTRHYIWWTNAMEGEDQLRQRLAFAWSQIFVVSDRDYTLSNAQFSMCNFYDMLAVGSTGNFRTLLEQVTIHPVMGVYLSMVRNERSDPTRNIRPDENFARELMQLFTVGLHELTPDGRVVLDDGMPVPAYDQRTVEEFAKVWTGWNFGDADRWVSTDMTPYDKRVPMTPWEEYHEPSSKTLLDGVQTTVNASTTADMSAALDNIFHHPNVGPFIARGLIQRLVTSNPTPEYVGRVAATFNDDGQGTRGNLEAVTKAILLDAEARVGHIDLPQRFGKFTEPSLRLTQLWRALDAQPGPEATNGYRPYSRPVDQLEQVFGQAVMRSESVFNFYLPDNPLAPGSDLVAPELSILSEINVASTNNTLFEQVYNHHNFTEDRPNITRIQINDELAMAGDPAVLVEHLNELLLAGRFPTDAADELITHLLHHPSDSEGLMARTLDAIYAIVGSPFHMVQS